MFCWVLGATQRVLRRYHAELVSGDATQSCTIICAAQNLAIVDGALLLATGCLQLVQVSSKAA